MMLYAGPTGMNALENSAIVRQNLLCIVRPDPRRWIIQNKGIGIKPMPHGYDHAHTNIKPVVYSPDFILHIVINTAIERTVVKLEGIPVIKP
jgi:hypothetical protein